MRHLPQIPARLALLAVGAVACSGDPVTAAPAFQDFTVSTALLGAIRDAELRLLPTVGASARPSLDRALANLETALQAGDAGRSRAALDALNAAITERDKTSGDGADLGALSVLAAAAEEELQNPTPSRVDVPRADR